MVFLFSLTLLQPLRFQSPSDIQDPYIERISLEDRESNEYLGKPQISFLPSATKPLDPWVQKRQSQEVLMQRPYGKSRNHSRQRTSIPPSRMPVGEVSVPLP